MVPEEIVQFTQVPGRAMLVKGAAGTGKTLLCAELARGAHAEGRDVLWVASRHMDPTEAIELEAVVPQGALRSTQAPGSVADEQPVDWRSLVTDLESDLVEPNALVVLDSLDGLVGPDPNALLRLGEAVKALAARHQATVVVVVEQSGLHPLDHLADAVLLLEQDLVGQVRLRSCRIVKMRGTAIEQVAFPFTLAGGRFGSPAPASLEQLARPVRPNPRPAPGGGIATTIHSWDLALGGGIEPATSHVVEVDGSSHALPDLLLPVVINALVSGWATILAGLSVKQTRLIREGVQRYAPDLSSNLHTDSVGAETEDVLAVVDRIRAEAGPMRVLTILGENALPENARERSAWWHEWQEETIAAGHANLLLPHSGGVRLDGADSQWRLEAWLGVPLFRGIHPSTPAFMLRSTEHKGHPMTFADVVQ